MFLFLNIELAKFNKHHVLRELSILLTTSPLSIILEIKKEYTQLKGQGWLFK